MVYGGIITSQANAEEFDTAFTTWRQEKNMHGELKWVKVSRAKLDHYISAVDLFFQHAKSNKMHFKAVVFKTSEIDYWTYHRGSEELGFYKFYYQFLLHKFGSYLRSDEDRMWVYIDQRSSCNDVKLGTLRNVLANGIKLKYQRSLDVVRRVEARDSKSCNLMQIADVLMGAVGFHWNSLGSAHGASPHKKALAAYIATKAIGLPTLVVETGPRVKQFEIWRFKFSGGRKRRPSP